MRDARAHTRARPWAGVFTVEREVWRLRSINRGSAYLLTVINLSCY
jgi:hypothetical protein